MTDDQERRLLDDTIEDGIRNMKEASPPEGFSARVMAGLEPKQLPAWKRLYFWLVRPQVLRVRPLQLVPVVTCAVALLALAIIKIDKPISENTVRLSTVRFIMNDVNKEAMNVSVIGSFNNWQAERSVMWYSDEAKAWVLEAQLPPGDHEYLFLVNNDKLVSDPQAHMSRDDGFGNKNSILFVNGSDEQAL